MWSTDRSEENYIGTILKELNSGKTIRNLLLEMTWKQRARLLMNIKQIRKCHQAFLEEMNESADK